MTWENFYLLCFAAGLIFTTISFLTGTLHLHLHLPGHGHIHAGHAHSGARGGSKTGAGLMMIFNPMIVSVFLAWFGGTGYLLVHLRHVWVFAGLALSSLAGAAGAGIVFVFVARVLMNHDFTLDQADYEMVGVLATVSGTIHAGGTGEIIFEQEGARKACAARSESGEAIVRECEVVVTRFENGIAYVRLWKDLADKAGILSETESSS